MLTELGTPTDVEQHIYMYKLFCIHFWFLYIWTKNQNYRALALQEFRICDAYLNHI